VADRADEHAEANRGDGLPDSGPAEQVFSPGRYPRRPDVRTRVAPMAGTGALEFEAEVDGQEEKLRALLSPAPAPQSGLAFEPEEGGARDRLSNRHAKSAPGPGDEDLASLLQLAAGKDSDEVAGGEPSPVPSLPSDGPPEAKAGTAVIPAPLDAAAGQAAFRGRSGVSGDIEAELFGPGSVRSRGQLEPARPADVAPPASTAAPAADASIPDAPSAEGEPAREEEPPTRSVASVFLSEQVLGKRRRRRTSGILRRSGQLRAVADRWVGRIYQRTRRAFRAVDRVTGKARLPLANIFWAAAIAGLSLFFGLALPFAGGILLAGLILTVAGQPARNLIGIAGIMILSASLAEVVRQRERFLEIFLDLFG